MTEDLDVLLDKLKDKPIVGIDLGTTNSGVSMWDPNQGRVVMLKNSEGDNLTPSMVGWNRESKRWVVGRAAKELGARHPGDVAYSIKRYIGRWYTDRNVFYGREDLTYNLVSGGGKNQLEDVVVDFGLDEAGKPRRLTAPEVSGQVLDKMRKDAKVAAQALNIPITEVEHAVVTVPAYFDVLQRRATILAGQKAGLEVVDILNEPTASALAYKDAVLGPKFKYILVYDLGGGTFDISLLKAKYDQYGYEFHTQIVDGNTRLGGDDIDASVARWLAQQIEKKYGDPVRPEDLVTRERLRRAAEQAKIDLSDEEKVTIHLPALELGSRVPFDAELELSREQLETCAANVLQEARAITRRAVEDVAGLSWDQIDEIILVGGQTLMPAIQRDIEAMSGRKPHVNDRPQLVVALGAGEYGHILSQGSGRFYQNTLVNVVALPLGIRLDDEVQPGAAVPHFWPMVNANVSVPHDSEPFRVKNLRDNERLLRVQVLQGPRGATQKTPLSECTVLGSVDIDVLPKPAGTYKFDIRFHVKENGTIEISVTDPVTNETVTHDIMKNQVLVWRYRTEEPAKGGE